MASKSLLKEFDVEFVTKWEPPKGDDLRPLIAMPNLPKPLHGCLRGDAEVLTINGWKKIATITTKDIVAMWDKDTEKILWGHPYETIKKYYKQMVRIKYEKYRTFGMLVSPDHRIPIRKQTDGRKQINGVRKFVGREWALADTTAAKINLNTFQHFITAARNGSTKSGALSDLERIYIAIQADGSLRYINNEERIYRFSFKKDRKKQRFEYLCNSAGVPFTKIKHSERSYAAKNHYQRYDVRVKPECKNFWNCFDISQFSKDKAQQFIDEISLWDGSCAETCGILNRRYVTTDLDNAKFAQAVAVIAGATTSFQVLQRDKGNNWSQCYVIDFLDKDYRATQSCVKTMEEYDDYAYCINVPTSYFIVRDADSQSVMITGNCAPRTLLGRKTWDAMRKACYAKADDTCEICGDKPENLRARHCLERGTEVLTLKGWKKIEEISTNDTVAGFTPETNTIVWENPTSTTSHFEKNIYRFGYKTERGFGIRVSSGHRMLIQDGRTHKYEVITANELKTGKWKNIPASGKGSGNDRLTMEERLYIALQADGTVCKKENGKYYCRIRVKKERKKERLKWIRSNVSIETRELYCPGYYGISFTLDFNGKDFWETFGTTAMSYTKATEFIDELVKWDGWEGARNGTAGRCYYSSNKKDIDFVQAVCIQANLGSHWTTYERRYRDWGKWHKSQKPSRDVRNNYNLEIKKHGFYGLQTMNKSIEEYNDLVFCITVPSSFFVARNKKGDPFITGNCHEVYSIDYEQGISRFEQVFCLCKKCHLGGIHTGRAITLYKQDNPLYPREFLLDGAEHAFTIISEYNADHPDEPPLRAYATYLDYLKCPDLEGPMRDMIEQFHIKFYAEDPKKTAKWGDWKLIIGSREYPTPFKSEKEWQEAMDKRGKKDSDRQAKNNFIGGAYDEIDKILKENN